MFETRLMEFTEDAFHEDQCVALWVIHPGAVTGVCTLTVLPPVTKTRGWLWPSRDCSNHQFEWHHLTDVADVLTSSFPQESAANLFPATEHPHSRTVPPDRSQCHQLSSCIPAPPTDRCVFPGSRPALSQHHLELPWEPACFCLSQSQSWLPQTLHAPCQPLPVRILSDGHSMHYW